jgi:hemoglobin
MAMAAEPTPFERLGGEVSIDVVVDDFYDRVAGDPELAPFFDDVPMDRLRMHQKAFLTSALGGPDDYHGRDLGEAHAHLDITGRHIDLLLDHLGASLAGLGVSPPLIDEVLTQIGTLRSKVLGQ